MEAFFTYNHGPVVTDLLPYLDIDFATVSTTTGVSQTILNIVRTDAWLSCVWNALPSYVRQNMNYKHFTKSLKGHICLGCRLPRRIVTSCFRASRKLRIYLFVS